MWARRVSSEADRAALSTELTGFEATQRQSCLISGYDSAGDLVECS